MARDDKGRWLEGASGNPAGKPRKDTALASAAKEILERQGPDGLSEATLIIEAMVVEAKKGNVQAFKALREAEAGYGSTFDSARITFAELIMQDKGEENGE